MSGGGAKVQSIDELRDFRAALVQFGHSSAGALAAAVMEIQKFLDWLEHDQARFWAGEIRKYDQQVSEARSAVNRKRIVAAFGEQPRDTDEQIILKKAQRRKEEAEAKLQAVRKWRMALEHSITEYKGRAQPLQNHIEGDLPRSLASLDKAVGRLENYLALTVPESSPPPADPGTAGSTTGPTETTSAPAAKVQSASEPADEGSNDSAQPEQNPAQPEQNQ